MYNHLKKYTYFTLACSVILSSYSEAKSNHKIRCGDGKKISVSDTQVKRAAEACLRAGHPAPKKRLNRSMRMNSQLPQQQADNNNSQWNPNDARLPKGKLKLKKKDCKYDPNSAKLPCSDNKTKSLLLPAVQAARESYNSSSCGTGSSISSALDQCGKKGNKFALCTKSGSKWSCSPSGDRTNPDVRSTSLKRP